MPDAPKPAPSSVSGLAKLPSSFERYRHGVAAALGTPVVLAAVTGILALSSRSGSEGPALNWLMFFGFISLTQMLWIVPLTAFAMWKSRFELLKGIWTGVAVVMLLNATCIGLVALR